VEWTPVERLCLHFGVSGPAPLTASVSFLLHAPIQNQRGCCMCGASAFCHSLYWGSCGSRRSVQPISRDRSLHLGRCRCRRIRDGCSRVGVHSVSPVTGRVYLRSGVVRFGPNIIFLLSQNASRRFKLGHAIALCAAGALRCDWASALGLGRESNRGTGQRVKTNTHFTGRGGRSRSRFGPHRRRASEFRRSAAVNFL